MYPSALDRRKFTYWCMGIAALIPVGYACLRLFLHVSIHDESWWVAIPYRFVLGDVPFVDELTLYQTAGLITYPLIKLFYLIVGDTTGIILYTRVLYLLFSLTVAGLTSWCLFRALKLPPVLGFIFSMVGILYVPVSYPNFGYNSLGMQFWALGCAFLLVGVTCRVTRLFWVWVGTIHALAIFAYPTLVVPTALLAFVLIILKKNQVSTLAYYGTPMVLVGIFSLILIGWEPLLKTLTFHLSLTPPGPGISNLRFLQFSDRKIFLIVGSIVSFFFARRFSLLQPILIIGIPLFAVYYGMGVSGFLVYFGAACPYIWLFCKKDRTVNLLVLVYWLPSFIGFLTTASFSSIANGSACLIPCVVGSYYLYFKWIRSAAVFETLKPSVVYVLLVMLPLGLVLKEEVILRVGKGPFDYRIDKGPFKGIYGHRGAFELMNQLASDLKQLQNASGRILFFNRLSVGYLYTQMRPAIGTIFSCGVFEKESATCAKAYEPKLDPKNLVIRMRSPGPSPKLNRLVTKHHRLIARNKHYDIFSGSKTP